MKGGRVDFELMGGGPKDGLRGFVPKSSPPAHMKFQYTAKKHTYNHVYVKDSQISSNLKVRYRYLGMRKL